MLITLVLILHVFVCLVLMASVLVQQGKGASMGAAFGTAGSQTVFGSSGAGNFLTKTTSVCAAIFFTTSLTLAYQGSFHRSVVDAPEPAAAETAPSTGVPAPAAGDPVAPAPDAKAALPVKPAAPPTTPTPAAPVPSPAAPRTPAGK